MAKDYKLPNSTVGRKISERTPLPNSLVKGSLMSRTKGPGNGHMLKEGNVGKVPMPPSTMSPPTKSASAAGMNKGCTSPKPLTTPAPGPTSPPKGPAKGGNGGMKKGGL